MKSDTLLDHAVFLLSPRRSRCDLFVFSKGKADKLASGFVMPFVNHLKAAEDQIALSVQAIMLNVEKRRHSKTWFTKGTLERFVRFVSTPEILENVNTLDSEMCQLEATQKLYSQGAGDHLPGTVSRSGCRSNTDKTRTELLRAIDLLVFSVKQDLSAAYSHAASAGFNVVTVSELQMFADQFNAHRLNEACHKFLSLCNRRVDLINSWQNVTNGQGVLSSNGSEISIDANPTTKTKLDARSKKQPSSHSVTSHHFVETTQSSTTQEGKNSSMSSQVCFIRGTGAEKEDTFKPIENVVNKEIKERRLCDGVNSVPRSQHVRRNRKKDRMKHSENKKETYGSGGKPETIGRHSSQDKAVPSRWSSASDMYSDLTSDKTHTGSLICNPSFANASPDKFGDKKGLNLGDSASHLRDKVQIQQLFRITGSGEEMLGLKPSTILTNKLTDASVGTQLVANSSPAEYGDMKNQNQWYPKVILDFNQEDCDKDKTSLEDRFKSDDKVLLDHEQVKGIIHYSSENDSSYGKSTSISSCETVSQTSDCHDSFLTPPASQVQRVKSKENLDLNDKLRMKANELEKLFAEHNELEKLFAEHKLRVPGESSSTRRSWVAECSSEPAANSSHQTPTVDVASLQLSNNYRFAEPSKDCSSIGNFSYSPVTKLVENHEDASSKHISEFSFAEGSKGKYYDTYLQRRNKKLTDEWSSRREEKEAKFKAMQESFECCMAEIKANFYCPTDYNNSKSTSR